MIAPTIERNTASGRLTAALRDALDTGQIPPCARQPDLWVSESSADRAEAADRCQLQPCPLLDVCHAAAVEGGEAWVWGGHDFGNLPTRRTQSKKGERT